MCLQINKLFDKRITAKQWSERPSIAPCNITVYKVLDKIVGDYNFRGNKFGDNNRIYYVSSHRSVQYHEGELKQVSKFSSKATNISYHVGWKLEINKGLHSYRTKDAGAILLQRTNAILIKCFIPKGTPYFNNEETGEYVSLKLQMPKKFENNK